MVEMLVVKEFGRLDDFDVAEALNRFEGNFPANPQSEEKMNAYQT
jgi:hypothetical protein